MGRIAVSVMTDKGRFRWQKLSPKPSVVEIGPQRRQFSCQRLPKELNLIARPSGGVLRGTLAALTSNPEPKHACSAQNTSQLNGIAWKGIKTTAVDTNCLETFDQY